MRNLGIPVTVVFVTVIIAGLLLASCGGEATTPDAPTTPTTTAPTIDAAKIYSTNCAPCHGGNRQGVSGLGLPLTPESLGTQSDTEIRDIIANGKPNTTMIAWKDSLSSEEIDALVQFIKNTSP